MNFSNTLMGVVQFWLERPVSPDGKIASSKLAKMIVSLQKEDNKQIYGDVVQFWLERRPVTPEVASSSLVVPATT